MPRNNRWSLLLVIFLLLGGWGGCKRKAASPQPASDPATASDDSPPAPIVSSLADADFLAAPKSPQEALERIVKAYRTASSYHDRAVAVLTYDDDGEPRSEETAVAVAFHRPSHALSVEAYQVRLHCEQGVLKARILDPATKNFDNQVVEAEIPTPLTLAAFQQFPVLAELLDQGMVRMPIQLELLLGEQPLAYFRGEETPKELLKQRSVLGRPCHGVAVGPPEQRFVFWSDAELGILRQLDYPTSAMQQAAGKQMRLSVQFRDADVTHDPQRFEWSQPDEATIVKFFVPPPQPLPTSLYGKTPAPFQFVDVDGRIVSQESLKGKLTVLAWFSQHPTCRPTLQQLTQVRQRWTREEVEIMAVCTEPEQVSTAALAALLRQWGVELPAGPNASPLVRDTDAAGRDVFELPSVPTLVVLDARGKLHVFDVGYNPNLASELGLVLRMLKDGKDVSQQVLERAENERAAYHQDLIAVGAKGIRVEFPVKPRREPQRIRVARRWAVSSIKHPGNILVQPAGDSYTLAILDGLRTVAVLDAGGELLENTELDLPSDAGVTWLKASPDGNWLAAGTPGADQVFLLDRRWRRVATYPEDPLHDGLLDAAVIPAENEGMSLALGFRGAGLQRVEMLKPAATQSPLHRSWSNRECDSPLSVDLVETGEGWRVLAADPAGMFYVFSTDGKKIGGPLRPGNWPLYSIHAAQFAHAPGAVLCGVSYDALGQRIAVGLDLSLQEQWKIPLGGGAFATPLESVTSGRLFGQACWALASPDGVIDIITADGKIRDQFHYGAMVRGMAILPDQSLVVSTAETVECWELRAAE